MKEHDIVTIKASGLSGTIVHEYGSFNFAVEFVDENGETQVQDFNALELQKDRKILEGKTIVICGFGGKERAMLELAGKFPPEELIILTADEAKIDFGIEVPPHIERESTFPIRNFSDILPDKSICYTDYGTKERFDFCHNSSRREMRHSGNNRKIKTRKPKPKKTHRKKKRK
jgi:hypothetical protein